MICGDEYKCVVLQWEPSNARWYAPDFCEGRDEVGSYWDYYDKREKKSWKIISIREI